MSADSSNSINNNAHPNKQKRILIVDDEPDIISVFEMVLKMSGFEVDAYNDSLLALSNFKPNSYGLVLLDIRMPKISGFELYKRMRNIDDRIKVCFMTAFEDYDREFKETFPTLDEAKCFIRKPKAIEDLVEHVANILG
jgi:two-component system, OmpR family, response regulator ChvI